MCQLPPPLWIFLKIWKFLELEILKILKVWPKAKRPKKNKNKNTPTHPMTMPQAAGKNNSQWPYVAGYFQGCLAPAPPLHTTLQLRVTKLQGQCSKRRKRRRKRNSTPWVSDLPSTNQSPVKLLTNHIYLCPLPSFEELKSDIFEPMKSRITEHCSLKTGKWINGKFCCTKIL